MLKTRVVSVKFDYLKQIYIYDPRNLWVYKNLPVLVKKDNYLEYGIIVKVGKANKSKALPSIIRTVRDVDIKKYNENKQFESYVFEICKKKIKELDLNMKLIKAHVTFDRYKIIFLYTSGEHIDFKLIVRELVHFFKMKVEFKYIGVRNEAANIKSIGIPEPVEHRTLILTVSSISSTEHYITILQSLRIADHFHKKRPFDNIHVINL